MAGVRRPWRAPTVAFVAGLLVGQLDPLGLLVWHFLEQRLPAIKQASLAEPSPFERMPESRWIAESEHAFVIEDRYAPTAPVHLLVIPKQRYATLLDAPAPLLGEMLDLARRTAHERGVAESGFRIVINTNPQGGQTVYHLHMHVKGGEQQREPLLPYLWGRLTHARSAG
jgi:histidine triad (HIT) family protein